MQFLIYLIHFLLGVSTFDAVTSTMYTREYISLSAEALIGLGVWVTLPWGIKLLFGSLIDRVRLFGNNRKSYIYLGALILALSEILNLAFVTYSPVREYLGEYGLLVLSGVLGSIGTIFCVLVADIVAIEIAPTQVAQVQLISRIAQAAGILLAAVISGPLASHVEPFIVFSLRLLIPLGVVLVLPFVRIPDSSTAEFTKESNLLFWGSVVFSALILILHNQLAIFAIQMVVINLLLYRLSKGNKVFLAICASLFLLRCMPGIGPGINWWLIGALHADESYFGLTRVLSGVSGLVLFAVFYRRLKSGSPLTAIGVFFVLSLLTYFGLWAGYTLSSKYLMLIDSTLSSSLGILSMVPLGIVVATNAPSSNRATYMALTSSFMNMALTASDLVSKHLNSLFVVTRTEFNQLGPLLISSTKIACICTLLGCVLVYLSRRWNSET